MAQAKLEGPPQSTTKYRMMGCACNTARAGQEKGHQIWKTFLQRSSHLSSPFSPTLGRRRTVKAYHAGQCTQQIQLRKHPLSRRGTTAEQTDQEATNTTAHQLNYYSEHDVTVNGPHARRPTPKWPDMYGPVRERRPTGWQHRGEPRPPTTMPTNTAEHCTSTTTDATNQR